jgi:hypothetical protein
MLAWRELIEVNVAAPECSAPVCAVGHFDIACRVKPPATPTWILLIQINAQGQGVWTLGD